MGLYDRDYTRFDYKPPKQPRGPVMPDIPPVTKILLISNAVIFLLLQVESFQRLATWFVLDTVRFSHSLQLWRYISYQFLHIELLHLAFNMLALFFVGRILERQMKRRSFVIFYLLCGAAGGILYVLLCGIGILKPGILIGASASVLGLIGACAILYPKMMVIVIFVPMQMRLLAILSCIFFLLAILFSSNNPGGHAAHLGGMLAGGGYFLYMRRKTEGLDIGRFFRDFFNLKPRSNAGSWEKKRQDKVVLEQDVDRILDKVSEQGIQSLNRSEKATLRKASKQEQKRNKLD